VKQNILVTFKEIKREIVCSGERMLFWFIAAVRGANSAEGTRPVALLPAQLKLTNYVKFVSLWGSAPRPSKPMTDSERVPRGKGEKELLESEKTLKFCPNIRRSKA